MAILYVVEPIKKQVQISLCGVISIYNRRFFEILKVLLYDLCNEKASTYAKNSSKKQQKAAENFFDCFLDGKGCVPQQYDYG